MKPIHLFCLFGVFWTSVADLSAALKLPSVFANHMVLQREAPVAIWGEADPDAKVTVAFADQTTSTRAASDGTWSVRLKPMKANAEGRVLTVSAGETLSFEDVLVGEVWLCSGQSNMAWTVAAAANPKEEIASASFPQIRMFTAERVSHSEPQKDVPGQWNPASPETVGKFSAVAFYFGRHLHQALEVPIGLINSSWGGTRCEAWTSLDALQKRPVAAELLLDWEEARKTWNEELQTANHAKRMKDWEARVAEIRESNAALSDPGQEKPLPPAPKPPDNPRDSIHQPAVLFNAMIHPLIPFSIKGAIWYQGESNQRRAVQYQELMPTLINDWRKRWGSDFSFYMVQLASFANGRPIAKDPGVNDAWVELQEAQLITALTLPKSGIAIANDIGEKADIHPKNKREVGRRLALWALAKDYGQKETICSGPLYKSATIEDGRIRIAFDHIGGGLRVRDGKELKHFQIAGSDQVWHWAQAVIDDDTVVVFSDKVPHPVGVRYAWASWPEGANLINAEGLPASCFRSDDFAPMTLGVVSPFKENR